MFVDSSGCPPGHPAGKAHIAAEPQTGLVTDFDLTGGNTGDAQAAPGRGMPEDPSQV